MSGYTVSLAVLALSAGAVLLGVLAWALWHHFVRRGGAA